MRKTAFVVTVMLVFAVAAFSQDADPEIVRHIDSIKAIDNHAHVQALNHRTDEGYDQLRCDDLPASPNGLPPASMRFGPVEQSAVRTLYSYEMTDDRENSIHRLEDAAANAREKNGNQHFAWVLDKSGISVVLANRTVMPPELQTPQFRWVPYGDALVFPLDNSALKKLNPDRKALFTMIDELEHSYLRDVGQLRIPATLDDYLKKIVLPTLREQKKAGAVAVKFEAAYLRTLAFDEPDKTAAARTYAKYAFAGSPPPAEYKNLQDYLFKQIAIEAGRLSMAVHIHTGGGCGEYFDSSGADALLLSQMLNDPDVRETNFVLLHGNRPRERNITDLIGKPNVYVDTSVLEYFSSPQEMAQVLRPWLEMMPEHVIFGTDAGPFGPGLEWEETTLMGAQQFRKALAIVLSGMVKDAVVTKVRAMQIATLVMRGNAATLYGIK
jgi:uncharacterized protein